MNAKFPHFRRRTTYLCVALQMLSFTTLARSGPVGPLPEAQRETLFNSRTATYTLTQGDTVDSVARRFGLTVEQLKQLNAFRTYSKSFEALAAGDDVDVPAGPQWGNAPKGASASAEGATANKEVETWLAGKASTAGRMLESEGTSRQAASMAKGMAVGAAQSETETWLNQLGTARVRLSVDNDFTLAGSSLDLLTPWFDNGRNMLFSQIGVRHLDERTTVNLGGGVRHFTDAWMFGGNVFFDNDLTGHNRRVGLGGEAWTDYLKLSANSYMRTTGWHQSRDFADYDERPANGYDLRAQAYLPSYPQLGGSVMYEKYKGDEVALFGRDDRQKDPYAITAGVTYTPVPLVTLGLEHKAGASGHRDTSASLELNYQVGTPWEKQIDGALVSAQRLLSGSRTDLVERNNQIVLEYKKQQLVKLSLPDTLPGNAGDTVTLNAVAQAKYGVERIEWDTAALEAAGGEVVVVSKTTLALKLPPYRGSRDGVPDEYLVSGVAYDGQGNGSPRAATRVLVSPAVAQMTDLVVTGDNAAADGASVVTLTTSVMAGAGTELTPVAGARVRFENPEGVLTFLSPQGGEGVTNDKGQIIATVVSSKAGTFNVVARLDDGSERRATLTFVTGEADAKASLLTTATDGIHSDGVDSTLLTLTLKNASEHPVTGQRVGFVSDLPGVTFDDVTDNGEGTYTAVMRGTTSGVANISATLSDAAFDVAPVRVTLFSQVDIVGEAVVGEILTATCNGGSCSGATTYQWQVEDVQGGGFVDIAGATSATYKVAREDQKKRIQIVIGE